ncbi:hypothetical protein MSPGM_06970 [Methylorubrum sp. GM97]|nr:hypothetical protein MSPGM_06970 [Methylorubrum sp. GM97]
MKYDRHDPFDFAARRHIGPKLSEIDQMLETVGAKSLHALIDETLPPTSGRPSTSISAPP